VGAGRDPVPVEKGDINVALRASREWAQGVIQCP
jgi:hypothetical protein